MVRAQYQASLVTLLILGASAWAISPVPRKSPEFVITEPSGKQVLLSSLKGKVVLIEFLMTNCPHCARASATIGKLRLELGSRGFEPIGIAFQPGLTPRMVTDFVGQFRIGYPVGYSSPKEVDSYLGRSVMERLMVPQIVVIDRQGVIRAQNDRNLEDENYLRALVEKLLRE